MPCDIIKIPALASLAQLALTDAQAHAASCLEPCAEGEMYSENAEMRVAINQQAWS